MGKVYYAVYKDNKYVRDAVVYDTPLSNSDLDKGRKLSNACMIVLLDADTGIILPYAIIENADSVTIEGIESDAVIKFAHGESDGEVRGWVSYNASNLSKDLEFDFPFDYESSLAGYVLSYDNDWDLRITRDLVVSKEYNGVINVADDNVLVTRELRASGDPIMLFRYQLTKKNKNWRFCALDREVNLCNLLKCYCETVVKLQNRAVLFGVNPESEECGVSVIRELQRKFSSLSDENFVGMPCDLGVLLHSNINYYDWEEENDGQHLSICFSITPAIVQALAEHGTPFWFVLLKNRNKTQIAEFEETFKKYSPKTCVRYV